MIKKKMQKLPIRIETFPNSQYNIYQMNINKNMQT